MNLIICVEQILLKTFSSQCINNTYTKFIISNKYILNESSQGLLSFLRSKDDSLILLLSCLIYTYINSTAVDPCILYHSRLYPIGKYSDKKPEEHSEESEESKVWVDEESSEDSKFLDTDSNVSCEATKMKKFNEHVLSFSKYSQN